MAPDSRPQTRRPRSGVKLSEYRSSRDRRGFCDERAARYDLTYADRDASPARRSRTYAPLWPKRPGRSTQ
ncbi:hypothetical protein ACWDYJ_01730 [Streptomyces sp. NPDC003042]